MRVLGVLCQYELVSRWVPHDVLIRGPFSDGSGRRRLANRALACEQQVLRCRPGLRLHVSSENPFAANYQSFEESGCEFGLGHEIRVGDGNYCRLPHWLNYVDFRDQGIPSPEHWVRLGSPLSQEQLIRPLQWNRPGAQRAVFVASYLNAERRFLMQRASLALPIDGFGRAFDLSIADQTRSSFTKRQLLRDYRFNFCPENAISPGYVTEKIPESFACGSIPIGYVDPHVAVDFDPRAFLNLHDYLAVGVEYGLGEALASRSRLDQLIEIPLLRKPVSVEGLISFLKHVIVQARGD
jgi:hypothetical protein